MALFGYSKSHFFVAEAFTNQLKVYPSNVFVENPDDAYFWQNVENIYYQDLFSDDGIEQFRLSNSSYIVSDNILDKINKEDTENDKDNEKFEDNSSQGSTSIDDVVNIDNSAEVGEESNENNGNDVDDSLNNEGGAMQDVEAGDSNENEIDGEEQGDGAETFNNDETDSSASDESIGDAMKVNNEETVVDDTDEDVKEDQDSSSQDEFDIYKEQEQELESAPETSPQPEPELQSESEPSPQSESTSEPKPQPEPEPTPEPAEADSSSEVSRRHDNLFYCVKNLFSFNSANAQTNLDEKIVKTLLFEDFSVPLPIKEGDIEELLLNLSFAGRSDLDDYLQISIGNGDIWSPVGQIAIGDYETSNKTNNGYFSFDILDKADFNWDEINDLDIKIDYISSQNLEERMVEVYIDSVWMEVVYNSEDEEIAIPESDEEMSVEDQIKKEINFDLISEKKQFDINDQPGFKFKIEKKRGLITKMGAEILNLFRDEYSHLDIKAKINNPEMKEADDVDVALQYLDNGEFEIKLDKNKERQFKPGKYNLDIQISDSSLTDGRIITFNQDFTWGVLAVNVNKSVYLPEEEAFIQMGVLDDLGHTICNSDLYLEVTAPDGGIANLNTDNGLITRNKECGPDNIIDTPDYFAKYQVGLTGEYLIKLTANTENGTREIEDVFYVEESIPFEIERVGPTRIFPWAGYNVSFNIKSNINYKGTFKEFVPASFDITKSKNASVSLKGEVKEIIWKVDWKKGETYKLSYIFDAPNISPEFYFLGPAWVGNFQERRMWQIASDAAVNTVYAERMAIMSGSTSYTNLVTASSSLFDASSTYFIFVNGGFSHSGNNSLTDFRINYGASSQFTGRLEPAEDSNDVTPISWFDVYTQPSTPVDITLDFRSSNTTPYGANAQIFALKLDDISSSKWKYAEDTGTYEHNNSSNYTQRANLTLDAADGEKDWLVFANEEVQIDTVIRGFQGEIYDGTNSYMGITKEGEDSTEVQTYSIFRTFDNVPADTTYGIRVADINSAVGNQNTHLKSRVFAIDLGSFESYKSYYADTNTSIGNTWVEAGNLNSGGNYQPVTEGNQVIFGMFVNDTNDNDPGTNNRLQVNSVTTPSGWDWEQSILNGLSAYDPRDEVYNTIMTRINIPTTGYSIDLDAIMASNETEYVQVIDEVSMTVFSTEVPAASLEISADDQQKSNNTSITNGDWSNDSTIKLTGSVVKDTTATTTFYFQLVGNSDSFATSTIEPVGACSSGIAYGSCSGNIWEATVDNVNWYDDAWVYRKKITINSSEVSDDFTDFPLFASTTDLNLAHINNGGKVASSTGGDILVTDSDGTTLLNFEREYYASSTGELAFWVKTDLSSSTDKILYIYYGNAAASQDLSTTTGAWNDNYLGVWHLDESPTNGGIHYDSTQYGKNGTFYDSDSDSDTSIMGPLYGADNFTGDTTNDDYVRVSTFSNLANSNEATISFWANQDTNSLNDYTLWADGNVLIQFGDSYNAPGATNLRIRWSLQGDWRDSHTALDVLDTGNWNYWTFTFDTGNAKIYKNGVSVLDENETGGQTAINNTSPNYDIALRSGSGSFDGSLDEYRISDVARTSKWIETEYKNQTDVSALLNFGDQATKSIDPGIVTITSIPDSSTGYKWQVIAFDDDGDRSAWREFNTTIPNFKIDTTPPQAPGNLTVNSKTGSSITLDYGYQTTEANFKEYKIFYKEGLSGVAESDIEHDDADLDYLDYAGSNGTTINNLNPNTQYVINIWAYDDAGNSASSTELMVTTGDGGRANTVEVIAGTYSSLDGTTGQNTDTDYTFSEFEFMLPETGVEIKSAYIDFESRFEAYANNAGNYTGYNLAFDMCQDPCTVDAFTGNGRILKDDNTILAYDEAESNHARLLLDVSDEVQLSSYTGDGALMKGQVGYRIERGTPTNSIASAKAILIVTYLYDKDSNSFANTVLYPLESQGIGDSGSRQGVVDYDCVLNSTCPLFDYNIGIPEISQRLSQFYRIYNQNDANGGNDLYYNVNIQGNDATSSTYIHEAINGGTQGNTTVMLFNQVPGYSENVNQELEVQAYGGGDYYIIGGEASETYIASSASPIKTRTVSFPVGVISNDYTTAANSAIASVYFPENGRGTGNVSIKKAWFRIITNDYASEVNDIDVTTKVGNLATSSTYTYDYNPGGTVIKPSFNIIHVISSSTYSELEKANAISPKDVKVTTQNTDLNSQGGTSAELLITYTYTDETNGYLVNLRNFAGQTDVDPRGLLEATTTFSTIFPERDSTKTLLSAALWPSYFISDYDGNPDTNYAFDANISLSSPTCTNNFYSRTDRVNTFTEFYRDVTSVLNPINNQEYIMCISNNAGGDTNDGGAKMNAQLIYTYMYYDPPNVTVEANNQKKSDAFTAIVNGEWTNENEVYLSANATDIASGTTQVDFYFELLPDSGSYSTATSAPASSCISGESYTSCSSKIWTDSASTTAWYDANWLYRKRLTLNSAQIVANETGFPVLATTTDSLLSYLSSGGHMASSTGGDMVITDSDGITPLQFEREFYDNTTGEIALWIKTDISSSTNKNLYIYYGNSIASNDLSTTTGVWDNNYVGVWHLNESPANGGTHYDSSKYESNGTFIDINSNSNTNAIGQIDGADRLAGNVANDDYISVSSFGQLANSNEATFSFWANQDTNSTADYVLWGNNNVLIEFGASGGTNLRIRYNLEGRGWGDTNSVSSVLDTGNWHYWTFTFNTGNVKIYKDSNNIFNDNESSGTAITNTATEYKIGTREGQGSFDGFIDEFRISNAERDNNYIKTQFNNQLNVSSFISFSSTEESVTSLVYEGVVNITSIPDTSAGYKWHVMACNNVGDCSTWDKFNTNPNFLVDATPPTAPGDLTVSTTTATSITLSFGTSTTESNFTTYKIFYKEGISEVQETDTEYSDSNLAYIDYNSATSTNITGLESYTQYVINIWAYDIAGNKTSANEVTVMTDQASHARGRSVLFSAGQYSGNGTTGLDSDTDYTFPQFNFELAETEVNIRNAYVIFEAHFESYANNANNYDGYALAFDSCQEPCTANAYAGTSTLSVADNTILAYNEDESNHVRILFDVTDELDLSNYSGDSAQMEGQIGYRINYDDIASVNSISNATAILVVTYSYNSDETTTYTNTVLYPLESTASGDSGTRRNSQSGCTLGSCPTFDYNMEIPEYGTKLDQWFQMYSANDQNGATDISVDVNIERVGINSTEYLHESANNGTQGVLPFMYFNMGSYGFLENTNDQLEFHVNTGTHYMMGGEVVETYTASVDANTKTRTVTYPIGVIANGEADNAGHRSVDIYFPENGAGSGIVDVKKAWFRIKGDDYNNGAYLFTASSTVGSTYSSSNYVYNIDVGGTVIKPSFTVIHVLAPDSYDELEEANASNPTEVTLYVDNSSTNMGGVSAELLITYTYTDESTGYLTSMNLFAGQSFLDASAQSATATLVKTAFPELRGAETIRSAALLPSYFVNASDGSMPNAWFQMDADISSTDPTCNNFINHRPDSANSFTEFYKNVLSRIDTTDDAYYTVCYTNTNGSESTAGAKMNASLLYTYQWDAPPPEFTQNDWRWYENYDGVQPTTPIANENTQIFGIDLGEVVRMRMNIGVAKEDVTAYTQAFKLQFSNDSDCTTAIDWTDVGQIGGSEVWTGYNNILPVDGQNITSSLLVSTNRNQTYEEENPSISNRTDINVGEYAEWDWVLYNNNATSSSDYCFRMVHADDSILDDYLSNSYPKLKTNKSNTQPDTPDASGQFKNDYSVISNLSWINEHNVLLTAQATDPNISELITLYFELIPSGQSFTIATSEPTGACAYGTDYGSCASNIWFVASSSPDDYRFNPYIGTTSITVIPDSSAGYKWQVIACDDEAECSSWVSFGTAPNFRVDTTSPSAPGNLTLATTSPTSIGLNFGATTTEQNFNEYKIYYREGTSGVTENDNEFQDTNMTYIDYNGAASTTVNSLSANTQYVFNIWAYDLAGNKSSSTIELVATTSSSFTPPEGSIVSASQKTDGSGVYDIVIAVDDFDNDNTLRAKIEYEEGLGCTFASTSDPTLDETDENVTATYGDPGLDNESEYQVGTTSAWILTSFGENYVHFDWKTKTDLPGVNGSYCLRLTVNDTIYTQNPPYDTRPILIDNVAPSAPGALTLDSKDFDSVTLKFGSQSSDPRFNEYRIYYKKGTSSVSTSDTLHVDPNLDYVNYNNATTTTVTGLEPNTNYVFEIWAFDSLGNNASSTVEYTVKTNAKPSNITAVNQFKSDGTTSIVNNGWTNDENEILTASVHDQDQNENMDFYFQLLDNSSSFSSGTNPPSVFCDSGVDSFASCTPKIWKISTSSVDLQSDWYGSDWLYRKQITISSTTVAGDENNYSVLINITDSDLIDKARSDGYDIIFTDSSGTSTLNFEREYFNDTTGELTAWAQTDISSSSDTVLYMYYGNSTYDSDNSSSTLTFDTNYVGIWHLDESVVDEGSQVNIHYDASINNNLGDQYGNNEMISQINYGQEFDGIDDYIYIGDTGQNINTISLWIKPVNLDDYVLDLDGGSHTIEIVGGYIVANGFAAPTYYVDGVATSSIDTNWHHLVITTNTSINVSDLSVGKVGSNYFEGLIDEFEMHDVVRDAQWITTQFNNQSGNLINLNSEFKVVSYYEAALIITIPDSNSGYKWQVMACDDDNDCSGWGKFNATIPNFKVDTLAPTAPGNLTENSKTSDTITINYGSQTTETNFLDYKIFYSTSSPATESDYEYDVLDLDYKDYNSETITTLTGLYPDTVYYINIWAYDLAGNTTSATELTISTDPVQSSPGAAFYTKGTRVLYYKVWDGTDWGTEQIGPTLGSGAGDNIRHIRTERSDDGGKIGILAKTHDGGSQEWWGTVYRFTADTFATSTQLGSAQGNSTNAQLITGCMGALSSGEFIVVRNNNAGDGTLVYSWNENDGWMSEGAGPNPVAVVNGCALERRPDTDNLLLVTYDDDNDIGTSYYYGGSTYSNSWTTWTQHSGAGEDTDNYMGRAFFDDSDNTRGAINYKNGGAAWTTDARYFVCDDTSINYGSVVVSPAGIWTDDHVDAEWAVNPGSTGVAYLAGRDIDFRMSLLKMDISTGVPVWTEVASGTDIAGTNLYQQANDAQKPYAITFYKEDSGVAIYNDRINTYPYYRTINASDNSAATSSLQVPGADSNRWTRVRTYNDPTEDEFIAIFQNDDVDFSAVFWNGLNNKFYNTTDNPTSNQVWTELVTNSGVTDRDDENISFSFASYNSPPNTPTGLSQLKIDEVTSIINNGWTNESTVKFDISAKDPDTEESIAVYLQLVANIDDFNSSTTEPINICASTTTFALCNSKIWLVASSTLGDYSINPFEATASINSIPDSSAGYKWQVKTCDDESLCSPWTKFNISTPNFKVDTIAPTTPGNLSFGNISYESIVLNFGAITTESNFDTYKIFYKKGSSGVTISDTPHIDIDLAYINYNGTTDTTVAGLSSSTQYVFNIWAYDLAGNSASATIEIATTTTATPNMAQTSYVFENDDGANVNSNTFASSSDSSLTDVLKGTRLNLRIQIENNGGYPFENKIIKLQFENQTDNPGSWVDVGASSEISYSLGLSGTNNDTINLDRASANLNEWVDGSWHENINQTGSVTINNGQYTEYVFAIKTNNSLLGKTYRFRLYNQTNDDVFDNYAIYPQLTVSPTESIKFSKNYQSSLPSNIADLTYFFDEEGYSDIASDDSNRDVITSSANYPIYNFSIKHTNNTDAMTVVWNGQSSTAAGTNNIYLQVYKYGSPNQWVTVDTNSTASADTDFSFNDIINSSMNSYYDASNWTYWRVYQASGDSTLRNDYFDISFSVPTAYVTQEHYRWRNDNGNQSAATWREGEDTGDPSGATQPLGVGENIRLRFSVSNTGGGTANNYSYGIEYASTTLNCTSGVGSWLDIPLDESSEWKVSTSTYYADNDSTTAQFNNTESYSFVSGKMVEDPSTSTQSISLTENQYTEIEYVLNATTKSATSGTYCFRVTNSDSSLNAYDAYPIITLAGSSNEAPAFTANPTDGGSDSTSPTNEGEDITFTATANDPESDDYYLAICKTNSISAGNDGPPVCTAGSWCVSDLASSTVENSCLYTASDPSESLDWYGFVCDKHPGLSVAKCSLASQGGYGNEDDSPFVINHRPVFSSVITQNNNQDPGSSFMITTSSSDNDSVGGQDTLYLYVCSTNSAGFGGCSDSTICQAIATSSPNAQCSFTDVAPTDAGDYDYYAFIYDSHGLAASSNSRLNSYTINNTSPTLGSLILNNGSDISLFMKGTDTSVSTVNASVVDLNGCDSLVSATGLVYLSDSGESCIADDNNCYQINTSNCVKSGCTGAGDTNATYTCTAQIKYYATPTDDSNGNPWKDSNWLSRMTVWDGANLISTTSSPVEMLTTTALDVNESVIDFGSDLFIGEDSGTNNATTTVENIGNSPIDTNLAGTDMNGNPTGLITVNWIEWNLTENFNWSTGNDLTSTGVDVDVVAPKATSTFPTYDKIYWGIGIPFSADPSVYNGLNNFTVKLDNDGW